MGVSRLFRFALVATAVSAGAALAQTPPSGGTTPAPSAPPAAEAPAAPSTTPAAPPAAGPPSVTLTQPAPGSPSGGTAPPPAPSLGALPTLVPGPGDPLNVDDVTLPGKTTVVMAGQSTWDDGFQTLTKAFARLQEEIGKAGIAPAGRPLTVFLSTDDTGFRYEAMIPIDRVPEGRAALTPEIRFGRTPEGKALRFVHKAAYEEVDSTYETITAYLDAKGVEVKDAFIEEYASDLKDPDDAELEINIYVQPK